MGSTLFTAREDAFKKAVSLWLETTMIAPMAHVGVILASGSSLMAAGTALNLPVSTAVSALNGAIGQGGIGNLGNYLIPDLVNPNIEGIPISSPAIRSSRENDVSEQAVIVQDSKTKEYRTDNSVPKPMEWHIDGYITSMNDLNKTKGWPGASGLGTMGNWMKGPDAGVPIKPTLILQKEYLDACQTSRRPVWFKTEDCQFKLVQIVNHVFEKSASQANAVHVTIELKEFNPYIIEDLPGSELVGEQVIAPAV